MRSNTEIQIKKDLNMYHTLEKTGLTIREVAEMTGGHLQNCADETLTAYGISIDSRTVQQTDCFFAIKGESFDGHTFLGKAAEAGAVFVIAERLPAELSIPAVIVADTTKALGALAKKYQEKFDLVTVAVTGSVGKTTTKEFISSVLETKYKTNSTKGNFNNEIGMPLTMLRLASDHGAEVLEMGMNHRGEIAYLSSLASPDIAVITMIGTSHIEHLGSRENIRDAKMEITSGMKKGSILIVNGDEPLLSDIAPTGITVIRAGFHEESCAYIAKNMRITGDHTLFDVYFHGAPIITSLEIPHIGEHNVKNALYAVTVGLLLGISEENIRRGLLAFTPVKMRQHIEEHGDMTFIVDCYNASPESMAAGLAVLMQTAKAKSRRPVAVLGDMLELGTVSESAHKNVGKTAAMLGIERLFTFGKAAVHIAKGAMEAGMSADAITIIENTEDAEGAAKCIGEQIKKEDAILFKASRGIALERVIKFL